MKYTNAFDRRGFTLVELLLCVGVISVLASLLGVSILNAKSKSHDSVCRQNASQFGIALSDFVQGHGAYPLMVNRRKNNGKFDGQDSSWIKTLFPNPTYLAGESPTGLFDCPAASRPKNFPKELDYAEYAYNSVGLIGSPLDEILGLGGMGGIDFGDPVPESLVKNPSQMLAIGDAFVGWNSVIADGKGTGRISSTQEFYGSTARAPRRHKGKANFVMCDGHVSSLSLKTLFSDRSAQAVSLWTRDAVAHTERLN